MSVSLGSSERSSFNKLYQKNPKNSSSLNQARQMEQIEQAPPLQEEEESVIIDIQKNPVVESIKKLTKESFNRMSSNEKLKLAHGALMGNNIPKMLEKQLSEEKKEEVRIPRFQLPQEDEIIENIEVNTKQKKKQMRDLYRAMNLDSSCQIEEFSDDSDDSEL